MPRPALRLLLPSACWIAASLTGAAAPAQSNPPPPAPAAPPIAAPAASDAAALGFLKTAVDRRVYSLEGAGAARLQGTARAVFEVTARNAPLQPTVIDFAIRADYATGERGAQPLAPPSATQAPLVPFALAAVENAFAFLPSRGATTWVVTFAQEGKLVRLDYRPQQQDGANVGSWTEWHAADGTPVRRRVSSFRPVNGAVEPIVQEVVPTYTERKGRLLLSELKPGDPEGRFSWTFEYEEKAGFLLLKKIVQQNEGWRLTLEFALAVEARREMIGAVLAFALVLAHPPRSAAQDDVEGGEVVATIAGRTIDAARFAKFVLAEREQSPAGADALDQLVQERLVDLEARHRGILVGDADVEARIAQIDRGLREQSQGRAGLEDHLVRSKIDRAEFRALLKKSIACELMMSADFGLAAGAPVPPEKQSLWFQELKTRARVKTDGLPEGIAAEYGDGRITRVAWALKIFGSLPSADADRLFDDFVGVELLLEAGRAFKLEVTPDLIATEIAERSRLLREKFSSEGIPADGVDYLGTLKARGEDPDAVVRSDRFKAEILLKELTRRQLGQEGFRRFYDDHRADFDVAFGRRVRVATIFLKAAQQKSAKAPRTWTEASDELEAMRLRIAAERVPLPESFAGQAKLRSEHESAARGGDLGFLSQADLGARGFPASLLDATPGALLGPIVTADGVHLLLVSQARAASPFEEIRGEVEKAARREFLQQLRKDQKVERKI